MSRLDLDLLERSQPIKDEIQADTELSDKIRRHLDGDSSLDFIGSGSNNSIYSVGRTASGVWIAQRELVLLLQEPEEKAATAWIYNSYCLDAEVTSDAPRYCIGGMYNGTPFLLVEDMTEGGAWQHAGSRPGMKWVALRNGNKTKTCNVDLGHDSPYGIVDEPTEDALIFNTFDINSLKYFAPDKRLNL